MVEQGTSENQETEWIPPPVPDSWPTEKELREAAAKEPSPEIELNGHRARLGRGFHPGRLRRRREIIYK